VLVIDKLTSDSTNSTPNMMLFNIKTISTT
jgi:hypothetical protein